MAAEYDATEFVDTDFQAQKSPYGPRPPPTRCARRRARRWTARSSRRSRSSPNSNARRRVWNASAPALEELRRRQNEFQTGRQEMVHNLTRGLGLLEEAEFNARRDAEQMVKTVADFRDALDKIQAVHDEIVDQGKFQHRTHPRADHHRKRAHGMELRAAEISRRCAGEDTEQARNRNRAGARRVTFAGMSFGELCKIGLAMTWPLVLVALAALGVFVAILLRH